jgi:hypothetical protein
MRGIVYAIPLSLLLRGGGAGEDAGMKAEPCPCCGRPLPVSPVRRALRQTWRDVYYGMRDRKGYDPTYAQFLADEWQARRQRERSRKMRAAKTKRRPSGWLSITEAGAILGMTRQGVSKLVRTGTLPNLLPETVEAYKAGTLPRRAQIRPSAKKDAPNA